MSPKIAGELNGQQVKLVKFKGPFTWHHHESEDELFYVVKGSFIMELRDKNIEVNKGEFIIVPKGVEHRPNAREEVWVMLFEPATTVNTGNTQMNSQRKNWILLKEKQRGKLQAEYKKFFGRKIVQFFFNHY